MKPQHLCGDLCIAVDRAWSLGACSSSCISINDGSRPATSISEHLHLLLRLVHEMKYSTVDTVIVDACLDCAAVGCDKGMTVHIISNGDYSAAFHHPSQPITLQR